MREPLQIHYITAGVVPPNLRRIPVPNNIFPPNNLAKACEMVGMSVDDARSPDRTRAVVYQRDEVIAILRSWGRSLPQIGKLLGGRDHSTIHSALVRLADRRAGRTTWTPRPENCPHVTGLRWSGRVGMWTVYGPKGERMVGRTADYEEAKLMRDAALRSHVEAA